MFSFQKLAERTVRRPGVQGRGFHIEKSFHGTILRAKIFFGKILGQQAVLLLQPPLCAAFVKFQL